MNQIGKPSNFDVSLHIKAIEQMILTDEVTIALEMMDKLPGYYRDNKPKEIIELKTNLLKQLFDTKAYIDCEGIVDKKKLTAGVAEELWFPRGQVLFDEIKKYNEQGKTPFVYELAPGTAWIMANIEHQGLKFNYRACDLNGFVETHLKESYSYKEKPDQDQPSIFVAHELLEHLSNPQDIYHHMVRSGIEFDQVHISTPKYTFAGGLNSWRDNYLGHLRTWTPSEFVRYFSENFIGYQITLFQHHCMSIVGRKINGQ